MKKEDQKYFEGVGRRKTSTARVRIYPGGSGFAVNDIDVDKYFKTNLQIESAKKPIKKALTSEAVGVTVKVSGSGLSSQADAVSLGLARAIVKLDPALRPALRSSGLLTRDPRMVERKKPGLKKARRAPQWAKR
ncbi:MAG: 30S ribosomal protein S9 [Candidatus Colwellbacteria bacterium]|jgi:small subunit ribosomal protein S9|nr:30S ribosomal protein S9 [Candidatus Colwellbacteria bacterium]MCK9497601.1 30S ribosomal protein S9 [Candidatus Colwellbacteria bacterium]MDD3752411.1 30S ribosomal protein S9 [Candidatus Colwellbacteria bacterium]MDD4818806.1 30S ribosomal protein S9 [Candidatus Colwellbacteria bacterium]